MDERRHQRLRAKALGRNMTLVGVLVVLGIIALVIFIVKR